MALTRGSSRSRHIEMQHGQMGPGLGLLGEWDGVAATRAVCRPASTDSTPPDRRPTISSKPRRSLSKRAARKICVADRRAPAFATTSCAEFGVFAPGASPPAKTNPRLRRRAAMRAFETPFRLRSSSQLCEARPRVWSFCPFPTSGQSAFFPPPPPAAPGGEPARTQQRARARAESAPRPPARSSSPLPPLPPPLASPADPSQSALPARGKIDSRRARPGGPQRRAEAMLVLELPCPALFATPERFDARGVATMGAPRCAPVAAQPGAIVVRARGAGPLSGGDAGRRR